MSRAQFKLRGIFKLNSAITTAIISAVISLWWNAAWSFGEDGKRLEGHVPMKAIQHANSLGRLPAAEKLTLTVSLPLRNTAELENLINRINDPNDLMYAQYLSSQEFTDRFSPNQADYDEVEAYFKSQGIKITNRHKNRQLLTVEGEARQIESSLNIKFQRYQDAAGMEFYAPDINPQLPNSLASRILHVAGLNTAVIRHPHLRQLSKKTNNLTVANVGSGPGGGLTPTDITTAYNIRSNNTATQSQQTLALVEFANYFSSDIIYYQKYFNLNNFTLKNIAVDGGATRPSRGNNADRSETTLDIQLQMALAPAGSTIAVYEAPNTDSGFLDLLNQIATDNSAKQISCSWGSSENSNSASFLQAENQIFQQMAVQGQTFFASAGDSGAYDDGVSLSVDDPAAQPYVTGVGGTRISVLSDGTYDSETTWNNGSATAGAGGGGISQVWPIPTYQQSLSGVASTSFRNVPDVALNADPNTGYAIFYQGAWQIYGGTSCAAPLWAAYTAQVNQERLQNGSPAIGFINPKIYSTAKSKNYKLDFHDIADNSNNLKYKAGPGYDNATGLGSFNGENLLIDLSYNAQAISPSVTVISPNGGESIYAGTPISIQWSSSNIAANKHLCLYFSKNNGKNWSLIRSGLKIDGNIQWTPNKSRRSNLGLIKICLPKSSKSAAVCDVSDSPFSIL